VKITQQYFQATWRVLEFGCGTGSTAIVHASHVDHILATDLSSPGLLDELAWYWRAAIKVAQFTGLAPYLARFDKAALVAMLGKSGFIIDYEWQPSKLSVFIVAKKPA